MFPLNLTKPAKSHKSRITIKSKSPLYSLWLVPLYPQISSPDECNILAFIFLLFFGTHETKYCPVLPKRILFLVVLKCETTLRRPYGISLLRKSGVSGTIIECVYSVILMSPPGRRGTSKITLLINFLAISKLKRCKVLKIDSQATTNHRLTQEIRSAQGYSKTA